ncbi:hypothetical protein JX265_008115 [Neoarthrinium moseri]|uniref:Uncharacterized protein n=1 Tax=Neoarthrinium moseri TaxID=1658444 RepID=A0A9P9WJ54_9PEZI|nr:hypothetical protein JX265_008115 [Neoarthrinium moseri]
MTSFTFRTRCVVYDGYHQSDNSFSACQARRAGSSNALDSLQAAVLESDLYASNGDAPVRTKLRLCHVSPSRPIGLAVSMHSGQGDFDRVRDREGSSGKDAQRRPPGLLGLTKFQVNFDQIGLAFTEQVKPAPRGPAVRSSPFSFLKEINAEEMQSYTPDQIATILEQRDNASCNISGSKSKRRFPHCRPTCELRSYLSLDGIAKGDIPPTAATGFGFHLHGERPVGDANIVKNIGYRPVPLPRPSIQESATATSSPSSIWSILDVIDEQIVDMARLEEEAELAGSDCSAASAVVPVIRSVDNAQPFPIMSPDSPYEPVDAHDVGLFLPFNQAAYIRACGTPLPSPTTDEDAFFHDKTTTMMEEERQKGRFHGDPLEVADGVAVMEESVELCVPDVLT